jgi:TPR repeat protein
MGRAYYKGAGVKQDFSEAVAWFRRAAEQDHPGGKCNLGVCYYNGQGVAKDDVQAYKWVSLAAAQGHEDAKKILVTLEARVGASDIAEGKRLAREFRPSRKLEEDEAAVEPAGRR